MIDEATWRILTDQMQLMPDEALLISNLMTVVLAEFDRSGSLEGNVPMSVLLPKPDDGLPPIWFPGTKRSKVEALLRKNWEVTYRDQIFGFVLLTEWELDGGKERLAYRTLPEVVALFKGDWIRGKLI